MSDKYLFYEKIDAVKTATIDADLAYVLTAFNKLVKENPQNEMYKEITKCLVNIFGIVSSYHLDRQFYHQAINEYRSDKLRAIERARRAEKLEEKPKKSLDDLTENLKNKLEQL